MFVTQIRNYVFVISFQLSNNHHNWVSMANFIVGEFSPDITESEEKLKNIIKSTYNKTLKKNLANCVNQRKS